MDPKEAWLVVLEYWLAFFNDLKMVISECSSISLEGVDPNVAERKKYCSSIYLDNGKKH